ncbi:MAG TPA: hypothetical protein DCE71_08790, partial [Parachlamydiales bacterium]|nr:hypothetical protein [Parachlamydiales bacterium]
MSSTSTETISLGRSFSSSANIIHMTLHWRPLDFQQARDQLIDILDRYESWHDPFSERLFRWGVEILP